MFGHHLALVAALALATAACTKANPDYCADARSVGFSCRKADAAPYDRPEVAPEDADVGEARDVGEAGDAAAEAKAVCVTDDQCSTADAGTPACGTRDGGAACVECTDSKKHCTDAKRPACDLASQKCVECIGSGTECTADTMKSVCNKTTQSCVECLDNSKCSGAKPICDTMQKACRACTADSECKDIGPGICVDYDGHCANPLEVAVLDRGGACDATQSSYCTAASAVAALSINKPILLVTGTMPVGAINISGAVPDPVLIVGRGGASVAAGGDDAAGIRISGIRKAWVRDLKITGQNIGVLADAGADLHLTRCVATGNGAGGIWTNGASFDISNTVIAANQQGDGSGGVSWAGARLGAVPTGGTGRFQNNTVVDNAQVGIACSSQYDVSTNIIHGNVGAESVNCGPSNCCGDGDPDPKLDSMYHLMSMSPCIGKIVATAMSPTVDIQGQTRPGPPAGKLDCGADQFVP